mmetsp:Transcript_13027/g.23205  ORF Transcript_13027/g.23205 Transcript_13027/m.23205 type:complete len:334 (-) Transcript_13027:25-1026(-)
MATVPPCATVATLFVCTSGWSSTGVTVMANVCEVVVRLPSLTVNVKLADVLSPPSCWKLNAPAASSACVKEPAGGGESPTRTMPPDILVTVYSSSALLVSGSVDHSWAEVTDLVAPSAMVIPVLVVTFGPSFTAVTDTLNVSEMLLLPSDTLNVKPAEVPSLPSCWKLTSSAASSACVKLPPTSSSSPFTTTLPAVRLSTVYTSPELPVSGSVLHSRSEVITADPPSGRVSPVLVVTTGGSFTGVTVMLKVCLEVLMAPSDTVNSKLPDVPSLPSWRKLTRCASKSAWVKELPAGMAPSTRTVPPCWLFNVYVRPESSVSGSVLHSTERVMVS